MLSALRRTAKNRGRKGVKMKRAMLLLLALALLAGCSKPDYAMIQQMHVATMQSNTSIAEALARGGVRQDRDRVHVRACGHRSCEAGGYSIMDEWQINRNHSLSVLLDNDNIKT